jgi:hypothetical protein
MTDHDPHIFRPGDFPTPFIAAEIRAGCPAGRVIKLRVEAPIHDPMIRVVRFVETDDARAIQEVQVFDTEGKPHADASRTSHTWEEFQSHASFPKDKTTAVDEILDGPMGSLPCSRYTVVDQAATNLIWFAKDLPGMPVRAETYDEGSLVYSMEMIENTFPS